jgi:hypothetical protein
MAAIQDDVRSAVDLITQPYLLEVLVGAECGQRPSVSAPGADPDKLRAAVDRLAKIGAVEPPATRAGLDEPVALTPRGVELLRLLHELDEERPV